MTCDVSEPTLVEAHRSEKKEEEELLESYRSRGRRLLSEEDAASDQTPEPDWLLRATESILAVLADEKFLGKLAEEAKQKLLYHAASGVLWVTLFVATRDTLRHLTADPNQKIYEPADESDQIRDVITEANAMRQRLGKVIEGFRADREKSAELRARIFGGRKITDSKPGWVHEFASILAAMEHLGDLMTDALAAMVPQLQAMHEKLSNARPAPYRPYDGPRWHWSEAVKLEQKTLHLLIDGFVSWSQAVAPDVATVIDSRIGGQRSGPTSGQDLLPSADSLASVESASVESTPALPEASTVVEEAEVVEEVVNR